MNTLSKMAVVAVASLVVLGGMSLVFAQVTGTMPTLYNQAGTPVNTGTGFLAAGNYYLGSGYATGGVQVEYYGNGTFYNPSIGQYGGSIHDANGTAGAALGYNVTYPTTGNMAYMPTLYNQSNNAMNTTSNVSLSAGIYYLGGGPSSGGVQIQYYGNGTFYNPSTGQYSGSVNDPNGTAGVSLGYVS